MMAIVTSYTSVEKTSSKRIDQRMVCRSYGWNVYGRMEIVKKL